MKRFVDGDDRMQVTLLRECLDDYIAEDNPVRAIDAFVEELESIGRVAIAVEVESNGRTLQQTGATRYPIGTSTGCSNFPAASIHSMT